MPIISSNSLSVSMAERNEKILNEFEEKLEQAELEVAKERISELQTSLNINKDSNEGLNYLDSLNSLEGRSGNIADDFSDYQDEFNIVQSLNSYVNTNNVQGQDTLNLFKDALINNIENENGGSAELLKQETNSHGQTISTYSLNGQEFTLLEFRDDSRGYNWAELQNAEGERFSLSNYDGNSERGVSADILGTADESGVTEYMAFNHDTMVFGYQTEENGIQNFNHRKAEINESGEFSFDNNEYQKITNTNDPNYASVTYKTDEDGNVESNFRNWHNEIHGQTDLIQEAALEAKIHQIESLAIKLGQPVPSNITKNNADTILLDLIAEAENLSSEERNEKGIDALDLQSPNKANEKSFAKLTGNNEFQEVLLNETLMLEDEDEQLARLTELALITGVDLSKAEKDITNEDFTELTRLVKEKIEETVED
ncbi:MAG: hypothetical protein MK033_11210 [Candidatus Caenarcaniphilales bacterium]|nr:hypothetical protein [Candidatus Caenarcaniphilales bacterium]